MFDQGRKECPGLGLKWEIEVLGPSWLFSKIVQGVGSISSLGVIFEMMGFVIVVVVVAVVVVVVVVVVALVVDVIVVVVVVVAVVVGRPLLVVRSCGNNATNGM